MRKYHKRFLGGLHYPILSDCNDKYYCIEIFNKDKKIENLLINKFEYYNKKNVIRIFVKLLKKMKNER